MFPQEKRGETGGNVHRFVSETLDILAKLKSGLTRGRKFLMLGGADSGNLLAERTAFALDETWDR